MDLHQFLYITRCSLRVCFIVITNLYCIPTYLMWMWFFFLPFRILNYPLYWYVESFMYKCLLSVVASWSLGAKYYILELGDDIDSCVDDRCLFLVNHQSTADVPVLMLAFSNRSNVLDSIMWIMDRLFRYTNFGAVSVTHGDYFITQGKNVRDYQMKKLRDHLLNIFIGRNRRWIVLFPEGGFLSKRKETSIKYAKKNNFPLLDRVTLPRVGAMNVIIDTLRPEKIKEAVDSGEASLLSGTEEECVPLKWVVDVTVAYPEPQRPLDLLAICAASRPPCITHIYYRRYAIEDVPSQSMEALRDWTYDRWAEKEKLLNEFYSTGKFPLLPKNQKITDSSKEKQDVIWSEKHNLPPLFKNQESTDSSEKEKDISRSKKDKSPFLTKNQESTVSSEVEQDINRSKNDKLPLLPKNQESTDSSVEEQDITRYIKDKLPHLIENQEKIDSLENITSSKKEILLNKGSITANSPLSNPKSLGIKDSKDLSHEKFISMPNWWIWFLHLFFMLSSVLHCYLLCKMWNFVRI